MSEAIGECGGTRMRALTCFSSGADCRTVTASSVTSQGVRDAEMPNDSHQATRSVEGTGNVAMLLSFSHHVQRYPVLQVSRKASREP